MTTNRPHKLPDKPVLPDAARRQIRADFDRFAVAGLPPDLAKYVSETYEVDVTGLYAGRRLRCPFGKGSGQLSMRANQVAEAAQGGLGLVVLKTLIGQDGSGERSMAAWTIHAPKMVVERITGRESGAPGWNVTWRGRGWSDSFESYLQLVKEATAIGDATGMVVAPSVKYHLPAPGEDRWRVEEYEVTTRALLDAHDASGLAHPLIIEKDFSPTLAGSDRASARAKVLEWLAVVPRLIRDAAGPRPVTIGLKLFNAVDDDDFQISMLEAVHAQPDRPDFLVHANRLFDPDRTFDGVRGVAYGGPDLSDRNLRVLTAFRQRSDSPPIEISATGDISSGRIAVEYLLRGCTSFQLHTGFQLPIEAYPMKVGTRVERTLHNLYFHPDDGLIPWLLHLGRDRARPVRLLEVASQK